MAQYVVRFGAMRMLGLFSAPATQVYCRHARVVARTERGLETATVLGEAAEPALAGLKELPAGEILRPIGSEDEKALMRIAAQSRHEMAVCQSAAVQLGLEMTVVDCERILGSERVVVYFLAEGRVDFRELVRVLAGELQTRVEMRQIGVRDEAKLLADFGDCGKETCCNSHLVVIPPVSMRMARVQRPALDPNKVSGRCGRLKCCMRYEYDLYEHRELSLPQLDESVLEKGDSPDQPIGRRPPERPEGCCAQMGAVPFFQEADDCEP